MFLSERPRPLLFALIGAGFVGVVAVAAPAAESGSLLPISNAVHPGLVAAAGTGLLAAGAVVCIKRLTTTEPNLRIVFAFAMWCLVTSTPWMLSADLDGVVDAALPLVGTGICAIGGQVFLTQALSLAPAG